MFRVAVVALLVASVLALAPFHKHVENIQRGSDETSYIVVFHSHAPVNVSLGVRAVKIQATYDMGETFRGVSIWLTESELELVRENRDVAYVEEDTYFSVDPIHEGNQTEVGVEPLSRPDWGQVRVDQKALNLQTKDPANLYANGQYADPTSTTWNWNGPVWAPINTASNVWVYVLDTGIYTQHQEFAGRAASYSIINDGQTGDCNGHGTHCAGTIGGKNRGVATAVRLQGVRVLNCQGSGTTTNIVSGMQWITDQNKANGRIGIMSASLGGSYSAALNQAATSVAANGVTPVIAAGNSNADAKDFSPASATNAIAVGATGSGDVIASFSNYGATLKVFAPGQSIHSAYIGSTTTYASLSGTSMATPLVAGSLALLASRSGGLTPAVAIDSITKFSTTGVVGGLTGAKASSPNRMVYDKWQ